MIGFNGSNKVLGLTSTFYSFDSVKYKNIAETMDDLLTANVSSYVTFHSAKIKYWDEKYPNKSAGMIITYYYMKLLC